MLATNQPKNMQVPMVASFFFFLAFKDMNVFKLFFLCEKIKLTSSNLLIIKKPK